MNANTVVSLSSRSASSDSSVWLTMEQEYVPDVTGQTSLKDLADMMSLVINGKSAQRYVMTHCDYVEVQDSQIIVTLVFYVFPHELSMPYTLRADLGEVTEGEVVELPKSRDIVFNGSDEVALGYLFEGTEEPSMPFFLSDGQEVSTPDVIYDSGIAKINRSGYCVYRIDGVATGYEHSVVMTFDKLDEFGEIQTISSLENNVFAEWVDANGELQVTTLTLKIPQCVQDALATCSDGTVLYDKICLNCKDPRTLNVFFNTCNGEVIGAQWADKKTLKIEG